MPDCLIKQSLRSFCTSWYLGALWDSDMVSGIRHKNSFQLAKKQEITAGNLELSHNSHIKAVEGTVIQGPKAYNQFPK